MALLTQGSELEEVQSSLTALERERKQLEREIADVESQNAAIGSVDDLLKQIKTLSRDFSRTFTRAPVELQKSFIRRFVDRATIDPEKKQITLYLRKVPAVDSPLSDRLNGSIGVDKIICTAPSSTKT